MSLDVIAVYKTGNILNITFPQPPKPRKRKKPCYWQDEPYHYAREEESLWRAVITQAVMDACCHDPRPQYLNCKKLAMRWLLGESEDFTDVCLRAGLEPSRVRKQAKKALLHPSLWRAAPGAGWRYEERRALRIRRRSPRPIENMVPPANGCLIFYPFTQGVSYDQ